MKKIIEWWKIVKYVIRSVTEELLVFPVGIAFILYYFKKEKLNIVICDNIGDFIFTVGYINSFKNYVNGRKIVIISQEKYKNLLTYFPQVDCEFRSISTEWHHIILKLNHYALGHKILKLIGRVLVIEPGYKFINGFDDVKNIPGFNLQDSIKYCSLGLKVRDFSKNRIMFENVKKTK